jgi:hypothetical protein
MYCKKYPARFWAGVLIVCLLLILTGTVSAGPAGQPPTPTISPVEAKIAVERAVVFPIPDRNAEPLTYLYERERVPVLGQTSDGLFLLVALGDQQGWILTAQADLSGDLAAVPVVSGTPAPLPTATHVQPTELPTRTPLPSPTPETAPVVGPLMPTATPGGEIMPMLPGVPPPLTITLPDGWEEVHLVVPLRSIAGDMHDVPLTIYFGLLPGNVTAFIYLYWGFPSTVDLKTGEYNLWADGAQILRGSLVGYTCNLGVYDQQTFMVGGLEGIGAYYQAADCVGENDTAGWFTTLRVDNDTFAFYVAVEPWDARTAQRENLQAILDSVVFLPTEEQGDN